MKNEIYSVIGGDLRIAYLAGLLAQNGITVFAAGLENSDYIPDGVFFTDINCAINFADNIILPLPASRDGKTVNAPFSDKPIYYNDIIHKLKDKKVFAGIKSSISEFNSTDITDYYDNEDFLVKNALLTAEGAVAIAITEYPGALKGTKCLVTGFGRIGKALTKMLLSLGADVTTAARKPGDLEAIEAYGAKALSFDKLNGFNEPNLIFNTVPAPVITEQLIKRLPKNAFIIDLASSPGGTDFEAAKQYSVKTAFAPGIPGKYSPLAAAEIIMDTIKSAKEEK